MKIAFVIPEFHKQGGTERCVAELAVALAQRGHGITVFSSKMDQSILPEARWHRVPMIPRPHLARFLSFLIINVLVQMVVRVFKGDRFDIVHSTGPDVLRPTLTTFHCCATAMADTIQEKKGKPVRESWEAWLRRWSNVIAYRVTAVFERYVVWWGARRVLAVSQTLASEVERNYRPLGRPPAVIPNGVNVGEFCPADQVGSTEYRKRIGMPADRLVVLFVAYNWEGKGLGVLVASLALLKKQNPDLRTHLVVVGGKGTDYTMEQIRTSLQGNVQFLGKRFDMPRIYQAADLCVLPSEHESFGLPTLEAMACGVPAIVSRCAGVAEIISDGVDGVLLNDPEDSGELAAKIEGLLTDPELRQLMGARARKTAERYSWEEIARQVETVYREVLVGQV